MRCYKMEERANICYNKFIAKDRIEKMIRLIAIDIDGTLVNDYGHIPEENLKAIQWAQSQGVQIVICTGRPYQSARTIIEQLPIQSNDVMINFNGGQIRNAQSGQLLYDYPLSYDDVQRWIVEGERLALPVNLIDNEWVYEPLKYPDGYPSWYTTKVTTAPVTTLDYEKILPDHQFNKVVIATDEAHLARQLKQLDPQLARDYQIIQGYPFQIEIIPKGINKGSALQVLSKDLNIPQTAMMGIGDQLNDVPMFESCGVRIAMENAVPAVKAMSTWVTTNNNASGVAHAIYRYIKK